MKNESISAEAMATLRAMVLGAKDGAAVSVLVRHGLVDETVDSRPYYRTNRRGARVLVNFHVRSYTVTSQGHAAVAT